MLVLQYDANEIDVEMLQKIYENVKEIVPSAIAIPNVLTLRNFTLTELKQVRDRMDEIIENYEYDSIIN